MLYTNTPLGLGTAPAGEQLVVFPRKRLDHGKSIAGDRRADAAINGWARSRERIGLVLLPFADSNRRLL